MTWALSVLKMDNEEGLTIENNIPKIPVIIEMLPIWLERSDLKVKV
jgi:hypothetical protein